MANEPGGGPSEAPSNPNELPQHPLVERLKPDPSQPAKRVVVLTGLPGKSDRNGFRPSPGSSGISGNKSINPEIHGLKI